MKEKVKLKLHEIAECVYDRINKQNKIDSLSLYSGEFGVLLFLYHYSKYTSDPKYINATESYTERLLSVFGDNICSHTFCGGLSGILFLIDYLREMEFIDIDISEFKEPLEGYMIRGMRNDLKAKNHDFLHGALGVVYYFLKTKLNNEVVLEFINYLYDTAEVDDNRQTAKWKSVIDPDTNTQGYNISLAHGMASIVLFLAKVIEQKIEHPKIKKLLKQAINYILSQEINSEIYGSFFPNFSIESSLEKLSGSRLAWCYGDLGVAYSLWYAGRAIQDKELENKGLDILLQSTNRRTLHETLVIEAGICHGSMSMVLVYRKMYIETNIKEFSAAMDYWIQESLNYSYFIDGLAGYKSYSTDDWVKDYSLLSGVSGVGLIFVSYLDEELQNWDILFLL